MAIIKTKNRKHNKNVTMNKNGVHKHKRVTMKKNGVRKHKRVTMVGGKDHIFFKVKKKTPRFGGVFGKVKTVILSKDNIDTSLETRKTEVPTDTPKPGSKTFASFTKNIADKILGSEIKQLGEGASKTYTPFTEIMKSGKSSYRVYQNKDAKYVIKEVKVRPEDQKEYDMSYIRQGNYPFSKKVPRQQASVLSQDVAIQKEGNSSSTKWKPTNKPPKLSATRVPLSHPKDLRVLPTTTSENVLFMQGFEIPYEPPVLAVTNSQQKKTHNPVYVNQPGINRGSKKSNPTGKTIGYEVMKNRGVNVNKYEHTYQNVQPIVDESIYQNTSPYLGKVNFQNYPNNSHYQNVITTSNADRSYNPSSMPYENMPMVNTPYQAYKGPLSFSKNQTLEPTILHMNENVEVNYVNPNMEDKHIYKDINKNDENAKNQQAQIAKNQKAQKTHKFYQFITNKGKKVVIPKKLYDKEAEIAHFRNPLTHSDYFKTFKYGKNTYKIIKAEHGNKELVQVINVKNNKNREDIIGVPQTSSKFKYFWSKTLPVYTNKSQLTHKASVVNKPLTLKQSSNRQNTSVSTPEIITITDGNEIYYSEIDNKVPVPIYDTVDKPEDNTLNTSVNPVNNFSKIIKNTSGYSTVVDSNNSIPVPNERVYSNAQMQSGTNKFSVRPKNNPQNNRISTFENGTLYENINPTSTINSNSRHTYVNFPSPTPTPTPTHTYVNVLSLTPNVL